MNTLQIETPRCALPPALLQTRIVAVLRGNNPRPVIEAGLALCDAGITCIEVTFTTPGATEAIAELRTRLPESAALGAGTVLYSGQARQALQAGAAFLVSPGPCREVVETGISAGVPVLPGAFTPAEVLAAWSYGASAVKIFPAASAGPGHIRDLRGPLPHIPFIPTGGIGIDDAVAYIEAGAVAVGLGSALTGRLDGREPLAELKERARLLLDEISVAGAV